MILSVGYDSTSKVLEIEFRRGPRVYRYFDVPEFLPGMMAARSKGQFFTTRIADRYRTEVCRSKLNRASGVQVTTRRDVVATRNRHLAPNIVRRARGGGRCALLARGSRAIEDESFPFEARRICEIESWRKEINRPCTHPQVVGAPPYWQLSGPSLGTSLRAAQT